MGGRQRVLAGLLWAGLRWLGRLPSRAAVLCIRGYQRLVSPWLPPACRFTPSCSHYAIEAYTLHGFFGGTRRTVWRLVRCHPWHPGGHDPVDHP